MINTREVVRKVIFEIAKEEWKNYKFKNPPKRSS
jgi:hypothetical protein